MRSVLRLEMECNGNTVGRIVDDIRESYVSDLAKAIADASERRGGEVICEPALRDAEGRVVREGVLNLPCRVDLCVMESGAVTEMVRVDSGSAATFRPLTFRWGEKLNVVLAPFRWDYCGVLLEERLPDLAPLLRWFDEWFDEDDCGANRDDEPAGVVHFLSDPETTNGATLLTVDFGSAPGEAFAGLLDALLSTGTTSVRIGEASGPRGVVEQADEGSDLARSSQQAGEDPAGVAASHRPRIESCRSSGNGRFDA